LTTYPWYRDLAGVTLPSDDSDKAVAASAWQRDLERHRIVMGPIRVVCLDVRHYNHLVAAVRNKSSVLFSAVASLIQQALEQGTAQDLVIVVDHQGGRVHYRGPLQCMFPHLALTILHEDENCSRYRMESTAQKVELIFQVKADEAYLPVSLASMVSKYVRELLVACINRHFQGFCPDLEPTAGYWQDGQRFLKDLREKCPQVPFEHDRLVRCR
jgi:ribonuclease HII